MLGKLFGSNSRVKLLKLFLLNPGNKYYIRQIARNLDLQLNSVRRELENLENFGLLRSNLESPAEAGQVVEEDLLPDEDEDAASAEKPKQRSVPKADRKYYQADQNFILYEEIKALVVKAQILYERDFVEKIRKIGKVKLCILEGFFVGDESSPVDLFVVAGVEPERFAIVVKELEAEMGREINYTLMDPREFKFRRDITDVFLYGILERKHMKVINELGV